ncbi:NFACT RNA binding domain-containing protein [Carboxydochorda subterranea]|uniref:NFACT RNA binding domain-containing protein n=1 Tax=Carboxydichorda subterranea TaxID=3109565 RepID=A0ABZ1C0N2_9FIRM|nr:NFACT RNA binding domain-containing protein [Limnochorda sp. L945t]WRP18390.1 NFACT RNA binding domain-containing protein [Limnochorda sp. L945t]
MAHPAQDPASGKIRVTPAAVAAWSLEIGERLAGAWVQRVYQATSGYLLLVLYAPRAGERLLVVDVSPSHPVVGLLDGKPPQPNPAQPPAFCMLVRKYLGGSRLRSAGSLPGERVLLLRFARGPGPVDRPPGERPDVTAGASPEGGEGMPADLTLAVELTGRTGNVVLIAGGRTLGWLRAPGPARGLALHQPYVAPPSRPASPQGAAAAPATACVPSLEEAGRIWAQAVRQGALEASRTSLLRDLGEQRQRLQRRIDKQSQDLERARDADSLRRTGELLLTFAARIPPGATKVTLPPEDAGFPDPPREVELDGSQTAAANAQSYFRRYRKAVRAASVLQSAILESRRLLEAVETLEVLAREADRPSTLTALREEALALAHQTRRRPAAAALDGREAEGVPMRPSGQDRPRKGRQAAGAPIARFRAADGTEILVGHSARANDHLTLHLALPGDWWLHARQIPGAHVVVRSDGSPAEATLLQAAALAARFSAQGRSGVPVAVDYTRRRYVRKPPGSPAGFVVYDHEKTVRVTPTPDLLPAPVSDGSAGSR